MDELELQAGLDDLFDLMKPITKVMGAHGRTELEQYEADEMAKAIADPLAWARQNKDAMRRAMRRPGVRILLRRHPEARRQLHFDDAEAIEGLVSNGMVGLTDEQKKKWYDRIQRALPVLKIIAEFTPPPYNFAVIGVTILLILIAENRLKPDTLAAIFGA